MGSGFSKMKKQMRAMEEQYEKARDELKQARFTGTAGNGLVTIILNGSKEIESIVIKPECVDTSDLEGLQDLIKAAHSVACAQAEQASQSGMPGGMNLPF